MRPFNPDSLTPAQVAMLRRVSASGASLAAAAVSRMTGWPVDPSVPRVRSLPIDEVAGEMGGAETEVVGLHLGILGQARGDLLIALEPGSALRLLAAVLPGGSSRVSFEDLTEMEVSALRELGNILGGAYLSAISSRIQRALMSSLPSLAIDMTGALLDDLLALTARGAESALVIEVEMSSRVSGDSVHILHMPDPVTLPGMLAALESHTSSDSIGE